MITTQQQEVRLWQKVKQGPDGCWEWTAYCCPWGYGRFWIDGTMKMSHRVVYEHTRGAIPAGLELDHLCRNPRCCNPDHLEPVTRKVNAERGGKYRHKTHCKHGHPYSGDNLYVDRNGYYVCRACSRKKSLEYYHRKQARKRAARRDGGDRSAT